MDRLHGKLAGCGLALSLVLANTGCRSTRPEVPPAAPFSGDGKQAPPLGFTAQAPNPTQANWGMNGGGGMPGGGIPGGPSGGGQYGIPASGSNAGYVPGGNAFGGPGTSGLSNVPTTGASPSVGIPQSGTGPMGPTSSVGTDSLATTPSQLEAPTPQPFK